ncbi:hypothetical protein BLNAU_12398 [Blattamonas nauphoetae]|uniref:Uncharacterized protein n=1 Tax=Blattamonas nauphoetae TaxID=2049346 RepID=A0ABQ9XPM0_9EUKA|nr:hypothetical protein BLNAU_12398 [Blattamonas nauphoetae]
MSSVSDNRSIELPIGSKTIQYGLSLTKIGAFGYCLIILASPRVTCSFSCFLLSVGSFVLWSLSNKVSALLKYAVCMFSSQHRHSNGLFSMAVDTIGWTVMSTSMKFSFLAGRQLEFVGSISSTSSFWMTSASTSSTSSVAAVCSFLRFFERRWRQRRMMTNNTIATRTPTMSGIIQKRNDFGSRPDDDELLRMEKESAVRQFRPKTRRARQSREDSKEENEAMVMVTLIEVSVHSDVGEVRGSKNAFFPSFSSFLLHSNSSNERPHGMSMVPTIPTTKCASFLFLTEVLDEEFKNGTKSGAPSKMSFCSDSISQSSLASIQRD